MDITTGEKRAKLIDPEVILSPSICAYICVCVYVVYLCMYICVWYIIIHI
jgi:hypothetical protein